MYIHCTSLYQVTDLLLGGPGLDDQQITPALSASATLTLIMAPLKLTLTPMNHDINHGTPEVT